MGMSNNASRTREPAAAATMTRTRLRPIAPERWIRPPPPTPITTARS